MALFKRSASSPTPEEPPHVTEKRREIGRALERIFGQVDVDDDGDFVFVEGTAFGWANVYEWGEGSSVFIVHAQVLLNVRLTPELYRYAATEFFMFGCMRVNEDPERSGYGSLIFTDTILANDIDDSEIEAAVALVVMTAADRGPQLKKQFGGKVSSD